MLTKYRSFLWLFSVCILGAVFYYQLNSGLRIETNILKLVPQTEADPFAEKAFEKFSDNNFKKVIFAMKSDNETATINSAKALSLSLEQSGLLESLDSHISQDEQEAIGKLYFNHRFHLLSNSDRKTLRQEGNQPFIDATLQMVYSPLSSQLIALLPNDPYLLSYRYLQSVTAINSTHSQRKIVDDITLYSNQSGTYAVVTATLNTSPFDSNSQQKLSSLVTEFQQSKTETEILYTGAIFYAQHAAASAKSEISTIGLGSLIGVIVLLIVAFKSVTPLFLTLTSLGAGIFLGFTMTHAFFGSVHVLTLVFGASLIGVAVDYSFHYFASANETPKPLTKILAAISLGLISSVIGYAALFTTPFPGLQQMALFCATGLIGAFLTVTLLFDQVPTKVNSPNWLLSSFMGLSRISQKLSHPVFLLLLLAAPISAGLLLTTVNGNNDSIRQLQAIPPQLHQQEKTIQQLVAAPATNQFFVVKGNTEQELLNKLHSVTPELSRLIEQGVIDDYTHLAQFVPPLKEQTSNYQLVSNFMDSDSLSDFVDLGLVTHEQLRSLGSEFATSEQEYLTLKPWLQSPLGQRLSYLWLDQIDQQFSSIITLHNIHHIEPLAKLAQNNPNLYFINKVDKVSDMFSEYRELTLIMLSIAITAIFLLLSIKYNTRIAGYIVWGPVVASSLAIIINILINGSFNLFSTLALYLVFGIGIDYGLFYAESKDRSKYISLAIGLSAITTFLSFGLLSLSETPAIHAFGLTMLTGILTVFLLSPILGHQIYHARESAGD